jgi:hypothetical protein
LPLPITSATRRLGGTATCCDGSAESLTGAGAVWTTADGAADDAVDAIETVG